LDPYGAILHAATLRLAQSLDCLAGAIAYLHHQHIRHKDLKPSNILLSSNGLWVTDFGNSTDFSTLPESATQGWERGTPKYFAPEVADYKPNGRSADIFSLGCVFLEIIAIFAYYSLDDLIALRPEKNRSYEANLFNVIRWFDNFVGMDVRHQHLMGEVRMMLNLDPQARPSAADVETHLRLIDGLGDFNPRMELDHSAPVPWFSEARVSAGGRWVGPGGKGTPTEMFTIYIGNTHRNGDLKPGSDEEHFWTFWVRPSRHDIVERVHMFLVGIPVFLLAAIAARTQF
jgi:serine/threonine protein kinase